MDPGAVSRHWKSKRSFSASSSPDADRQPVARFQHVRSATLPVPVGATPAPIIDGLESGPGTSGW